MAIDEINEEVAKKTRALLGFVKNVNANDRLSSIKYLIANGADVNGTDANGYTPLLLLASLSGEFNLKTLSIALREAHDNLMRAENAAISLIVKYKSPTTDQKHLPQIKELIKKAVAYRTMAQKHYDEADTNMEIAKDNLIIVEALIKSKADVNKPDKKGETPLMLASFNNDQDFIMRLFRDPKLDISIQDKDGLRAADYAADKKLKEKLTARKTKIKFLKAHTQEFNPDDPPSAVKRFKP